MPDCSVGRRRVSCGMNDLHVSKNLLSGGPVRWSVVVFALLAVRTGRLGPAIWAHVGFNAVAVGSLLASR